MAKSLDRPIMVTICSKLGGMIERSLRANAIDIQARGHDRTLEYYSDLQFFDNWYHARKLLAALRALLELPQNHMESYEKALIVLISVVRGGVSDPVPWVICSEYMLRELAINIRKLKVERSKAGNPCAWLLKHKCPVLTSIVTQKQTNKVDDVVDEFVLFMQGTVLLAAILRFQRDDGDKAVRLVCSSPFGRKDYRFPC